MDMDMDVGVDVDTDIDRRITRTKKSDIPTLRIGNLHF